jgi:hypothetical protein
MLLVKERMEIDVDPGVDVLTSMPKKSAGSLNLQ